MKNLCTRKMVSCIMLFFLCGFVFSYLKGEFIQAANKVNDGEHSGGFLIRAKRVEGSLDLLGVLLGKVEIGTGRIEGLEIFKSLAFEKGENIHITIHSFGPVAVRNLKSETLAGSLPEFTGLCYPRRLGWLCLENVTMVVPWQTVAEIDLPNARITTCFSYQCPRDQTSAIHQFIDEDREKKINEIIRILEEEPEKKRIVDEFIIELQKQELEISIDELLDQLLAYLKGEKEIQEDAELTDGQNESLPAEENEEFEDEPSDPVDGNEDSDDDDSNEEEESEEIDGIRESLPPINRYLS